MPHPAPSSMPQPGDRVLLAELGGTATVGEVLGEGGQGTVFSASVDSQEQPLALKWYFPHSATSHQLAALADLVRRGMPHERFLWPLSTVRPVPGSGLEGFGYVMPIRPATCAGLVDLVSRRVDVDFRTLATIGMELAHGFLALHNEGLCYRDISFGNVFFDPGTGSVLICDNDNVGIDGVSASAVHGTPYFIAPEVMRGEAAPSRNTDLWSLSVLLFYILIGHHPLEGRRILDHECWDAAAMQDLFAEHPVFIFDPDDTSNGPLPGEHDSPVLLWEMYPPHIRSLFTQAFTAGVHDADARVRDGMWRTAMARLRDTVVYCPWCAKQNLSDDDRGSWVCWSCGKAFDVPPRLRIGRACVMLNHDTVVCSHHLRTDYDFTTEVARVNPHPSEPGTWGLRNCSNDEWRALADDGTAEVVPPGRSVTLFDGLRIEFGPVTGTIDVGADST